ncbi:enoyl-CoA hydratase/isomerase family protein [Endozoicomonas sp. G2_2]|uniref:enoyl-CoA hydratase-related protein n=1 Tax=Endozoicomonas sp. G2_2 TaxID=2821092 RepID=UPI001ADB6BF6|nr:enoyl-CoA hydratase-related protein [Endozoicomonas sp. G2_2]MBO9468791.1 enoyl-CoA hydratase/isomerase family protein [Endozoicomonas sp. G2_2]
MAQPELTSGFIRAETRDGILRVTIDRADKRNALTRDMYEDMSRCVEHAGADDSVRTLLIDSEGDMFCAGNDVAEFAAATPDTREAGSAGPALSFIKRLRALDKPVVIAVQGQATGIGTTMLLHADLVVGAESARFFTAFIDLALVPEAGSSLLLPGLIGRQNAARLLLAGDTLDSDEALRMGLIAYRVPDEALAEKAQAVAARLAAKAPEAVRQTKQLLRQGIGSDDVDGQIEREAERFGERLFSDEVRAIMNKFLKRAK